MPTDYERRFSAILEDNSTVTEEEFRNVFLTGLVEKDEKVLERWIRLAGNRFMPVNIIDSENKILFIVPPVQRKPRVIPEAAARLPDILNERALKANRSKLHGQMFMDKALSGLGLKEVVEDADIIAWRKILTHFGIVIDTSSAASGNVVNEAVEW